MKTPLIKLSHVSKYYKTKTGVSEGMRDVNIEFYNNEFVAITGESGSGKTTLLNVISGLDSYEDGELYYNGKETSHFNISDFEKFRAKNIGFVFQNYNIVDSYTVLDNVIIALLAQNYSRTTIRSRALELIEKVGLLAFKDQKASRLSGGQKQRVVIARALAKDAPIILADEPTGNLDEASGDEILSLLKEVSKDRLVLLVSHNMAEVEKFATRKIVMQDGNIKNDIVLEKTELKEAELDENFENKNSFSKGFYIARKNIVSTPKRSIFSLALFSLILFAFLYFYSTLIINSIENMFSSYGESTISLIKRDDTNFTQADLNSLKEKKNIIYYFDFEFADIYETFDIEARKMLVYRFNIISSLRSPKLIDGRVPNSKEEILLRNNTLYNDIFYSVGDKITLNTYEFTVSGIISTDEYYYSGDVDIYFADSFVYNEVFVINEEAKLFLKGEQECNQLIISGIDRQDIKLYKKYINTTTYRILDPELAYEKQMEAFVAIVKLILWGVLLLILQVIFLVVFQIQKNLMETRKKDFSVYRSVGISEQEVSYSILFEQIIISLIAAAVIIALFNLLALKVAFFYNIIRNITVFNYVLIIALFIIFSLRLGQKFNKKIFNLTVIEALKEDN